MSHLSSPEKLTGHAERLPTSEWPGRQQSNPSQEKEKEVADDLENDLRKITVTDCRSIGQDREDWGQIVREAYVHPGL